MGCTPSVNLEAFESTVQNYFSVQMYGSDRLRLILAPNEINNSTRDVLNAKWSIISEDVQKGFVEFLLVGRPWYLDYNSQIKHFLCSLLQVYYELGWHLKASTDLERQDKETDVLFFQKNRPLKTSIICISLNSSDKIKVLGPKIIYPIIKHSVIKSWYKGIQDEQVFENVYELKLYGNPWNDWLKDSLDYLNCPLLILEIMKDLFKNGWIFVGAIDSSQRQSSLNALYFRKTVEDNQINDLEKTRLFAMSLNKSNIIRLHKADHDLKLLILNPQYGIKSLWKSGIYQIMTIESDIEIELNGDPWDSVGSEAVESRRLLNNLFNLFARYGWTLYGTCDLTKHVTNKSTFFFRTKPMEPKELVNFCVSLNETNKIRLIDGSVFLIREIKDAIRISWPYGIREESTYYDSYQIKLNDYPFSTGGPDKIYACVMMTIILNNLEKNGYRLLCSADVSQKFYHYKSNKYPIDLHSWFFEN